MELATPSLSASRKADRLKGIVLRGNLVIKN